MAKAPRRGTAPTIRVHTAKINLLNYWACRVSRGGRLVAASPPKTTIKVFFFSISLSITDCR